MGTFLFRTAFVPIWVWHIIFNGCNFASEIKNNTNMKTILFVIAMGVMLNLISCATPAGESSDNNTADTLTMEELEENFDSCQLGNTLDSIAHIEK